MIVDCHGHFTTVPKALSTWREQQLSTNGDHPRSALKISDDELSAAIEGSQLQQLRERGIDLMLFSPIAGQMGHHLGTPAISRVWSEVANDIIFRTCQLYPQHFAGVCQLPQSPHENISACVVELERCVRQLHFVGCNFNPDPSGGYWDAPAITDECYYPLFEKMCELNVPAMIHVSGSCNPAIHHTGAHYLNGDTTAFMQLLDSKLFSRFPALRFIIPHGGGCVPYHWGRYRGLALRMGLESPDTGLLKNVYFDTCVYHQAGIDLLARVIPSKNVLYGSEMFGAVKDKDPETGFFFDDTKRYLMATPHLDQAGRQAVLCDNAFAVYPGLRNRIAPPHTS